MLRKGIRLLILAGYCTIFTAFTWAFNPAMMLNFCPVNAEFAVVVIQPTALGNHLLQCKNKTGSTYYSDLTAATVAVNDPQWITVPYPEAWICFGKEPEDCPFF